MKKATLLAVLVITLLISGCLKLNNNKGKLIVNFNQLKAIPDSQATTGIIRIDKNGRVLQKTFDFPISQVTFDSIEEGLWNISVQILDQNNHILYTAFEQVKVIANQTNYCSLNLSLNTADLVLNVNVQSDQPDSISVDLCCGAENINEKKPVENRTAVFSFNSLKSAVWDMKITLFSEQNVIMTVPQTGSYGLELQPGRTNIFNVTIDRFGNLSVEVLIEHLDVVRNATLTNLQDGIKIEWDPVEGADSYDLYRKEGFLWLKLNSTPLEQCNFTDSNVIECETYYYVINAKSSSGLQSGFCQPFSITRDTNRVFVGAGSKLYSLKRTDSGFEIVKTVSLAQSPFHVHTKGNLLYAATNSGVVEFDSTTFEILRSKSVFIMSPADFTEDYLFLIGANKVYRLNLSSFEYDQYSIQYVNFLSVDDYLCTVAQNQVQVRDLNGNIITQTAGSYAFTEDDKIFVYNNGNLEYYTINNSNLNYRGSVPISGTPKAVDVYQQYIYVAVDDGFYVIDLNTMTGQKTNLNLTKNLMVCKNQLFVVHDKYLKVYDITDPAVPVQRCSYGFENSVLALFVD